MCKSFLSDYLTKMGRLTRLLYTPKTHVQNTAGGGEQNGGREEGRADGRNGNRLALFIAQLPSRSNLGVSRLGYRSFCRTGALRLSTLVQAGSDKALRLGGHILTLTSSFLALHRCFSPLRSYPSRPVRHSQCTRGPSRGTAALAQIALRSQLLPYSAQHDWGKGVSGPG